jgi:hypothetical protein
MSSTEYRTTEYRTHAEDCLRLASADRNEGDRPLWVTLAQSWLRLAEHADRLNSEVKSGSLAPERPDEGAEYELARD